MGLIQFDHRLSRQPPVGVAGLNKSHWLAPSTIFAHTGNGAIIYGSPAPNTPLLSSPVFAERNPSLNNSRGWGGTGAGSSPKWALPKALEYPITLSAWFYGTASTTVDGVLVVSRASGFGIQYIGRAANENPFAYSSNTSDAGASAEITGYTFAANTWVHVVGVFTSNTSRTIYVNGSSGVTSAVSIVMPSDLTVVTVLNNNRPAIGGVALPLILNIALTQAESLRLYREQQSNPWKIFAPKRIWVPVSAAGGPPTLAAIAASNLTASGARLTVTV